MTEYPHRLSAPAPMDVAATFHSHGWIQLAPHFWDDTAGELTRPERLDDGTVAVLTVRSRGTVDQPAVAVTMAAPRNLSAAEQTVLLTRVGRILRLDLDLSGFYDICKQKGSPWTTWGIAKGRLLASPTVFEDVVKTICTTNIQWSGTRRLVANLVEHLGAPMDGRPELRAFPTPEAVAASDVDFLRTTVRLGYRAPYVHRIAAEVAAGRLDLESLRDPSLDGGTVHDRLLSLPGVGPYAAASMMMLLGHFERLPVDSVFREHVTRVHGKGKPLPDKNALALYDAWGPWKALAYWMEMWHCGE